MSEVLRPSRPGRPRKVSSPEEFDAKVDSYVQACRLEERPITWTGMAIALGFTSRQAIDEYARYPEFSDPVKRAKALVERAYEERLHGPAAAGAIFALKNMGWTDERSVQFRGFLAGVDLGKLIPLLPDDLLARLRAREPIEAVLMSAGERIRGLLHAPAQGYHSEHDGMA